MVNANVFIVREYANGVLLRLPELIRRISLDHVACLQFREITLNFGSPFGIPCKTFEAITRGPYGIIRVSKAEFEAFLLSDFDIIDGYIDAFSSADLYNPLFTLENFDASEWLISTGFADFARVLHQRGFSLKTPS